MRPSTRDYPDFIANMRRRPNTMMAVVGGSLVVVGTAVAAVFILGGGDPFRFRNKVDSNEKDATESLSQGSILPPPPTLSPTQSPSIEPSASSVPSLKPSVSEAPSGGPSANPTITDRPSSAPSESPSISFRPSGKPSSSPSSLPSSIPSKRPSSSPTITFMPTQKPTTNPTKLLYSIRSNENGTFKLRLHWQEGFMWQETPDEAWFCMACAYCDANVFDEHCSIKTYCEEDMMLALVNCDPSKRRNKNKRKSWMTTFTLLRGGSTDLFGVAHNGLEGDQIQVHNSNLCVERVGPRNIFLKQCDASVQGQRFFGFKTGGQAMELLPSPGTFTKNGVEYVKCLTQHHHPRNGERVYAEDCTKARRSDTNMWSTY